MILGIEIGGTKLQMAVGSPDNEEFEHSVRLDIDPQKGAAGIRDQIAIVGKDLIARFPVTHIGVGFGGAVDVQTGTTLRSNQITGWENFPFADWLNQTLSQPATIINDCDAAALAEATLGVGKEYRSLFYITVGSGIGGGLVINRSLFGKTRPAIAEIGQLCLPQTEQLSNSSGSQATVESIASGWGMTSTAKEHLKKSVQNNTDDSSLLLKLCQSDLQQLSTKHIAMAAEQGDALSQTILQQATNTLGWAIAQVITLIAPEVIVIGGGVLLMEEELFLSPLTYQVDNFVYEPLRHSYKIFPASLGEWVVVHGAIAIGARSSD